MSLLFLLVHAFVGLGENSGQGQAHIRAHLKAAEAEAQLIGQPQLFFFHLQIAQHLFQATRRRVAV